MKDKEVVEAVREGAGLTDDELLQTEVDYPDRPLTNDLDAQDEWLQGVVWLGVKAAIQAQISKILSLRGNIENGKFIPSESGRYAVRLVDLGKEIIHPCEVCEHCEEVTFEDDPECNGVTCNLKADEECGNYKKWKFKAGFARIVGG